MSDQIRVLQLGNNDWSQIYKFQNDIDFFFEESFTKAPKQYFDLAFIEREISEDEVDALLATM